MINKINSTVNFNGYKNVISNGIFSHDRKLLFFTTQLDNNIQPDLDKYRSMLEEDKRLRRGLINDDTLTCFYLKSPDSERISLNLRPLYWGEELLFMSKNMPKSAYKPEEDISLKSYTLLAGLTKRMSQNMLSNQDRGITDVFRQAIEFFQTIGNSPEVACDVVVSSGIKNNESFDKLALFINRKIQQTMSALFK